MLRYVVFSVWESDVREGRGEGRKGAEREGRVRRGWGCVGRGSGMEWSGRERVEDGSTEGEEEEGEGQALAVEQQERRGEEREEDAES